jgi:hypothetical protein
MNLGLVFWVRFIFIVGLTAAGCNVTLGVERIWFLGSAWEAGIRPRLGIFNEGRTRPRMILKRYPIQVRRERLDSCAMSRQPAFRRHGELR